VENFLIYFSFLCLITVIIPPIDPADFITARNDGTFAVSAETITTSRRFSAISAFTPRAFSAYYRNKHRVAAPSTVISAAESRNTGKDAPLPPRAESCSDNNNQSATTTSLAEYRARVNVNDAAMMHAPRNRVHARENALAR